MPLHELLLHTAYPQDVFKLSGMGHQDLLTRIATLVGAATTDEQYAHALLAFAVERQWPVHFLLDAVALEVARGFNCGSLSYEDAIDIMANLHSAMLTEGAFYTVAGESFTAKVYWALDEGEYVVETDDGRDPIDTRVRLEIRRLLADAPASNP